ncbi:MAG: hypothetical protein HQK86_05840 [Nitrospinae bacterium]|nr:hypothetical protein [Nitrospinota bacterium]
MSKVKADRFAGVDVAKSRLDVMVVPDKKYFMESNDEAGAKRVASRLKRLGVRACRPKLSFSISVAYRRHYLLKITRNSIDSPPFIGLHALDNGFYRLISTSGHTSPIKGQMASSGFRRNQPSQHRKLCAIDSMNPCI